MPDERSALNAAACRTQHISVHYSSTCFSRVHNLGFEMPNSSRSGVNDIYSQFQVQMIKGLQCATAEYQAIGVASAAKTYQNLRYDSADILCHSHHNAPISHHNIMFYQVYHTIFHKHNNLLCNTTGPHRAVQFACGSCLNIRWAADSYRLQCCLEGG